MFDSRMLYKTTEVPHSCSCGEQNPTRRHWFWDCPDTGGSGESRKPVGELEGGIAVPVVPRYSINTPRRQWEQLAVKGMLRRAPQEALVATDEGFKGGIATTGIAIELTSGEKLCEGAPVTGETQTSYIGELEALASLFQAARGSGKMLTIAIDNSSVVGTYEGLVNGDGQLPRWCFGQWEHIAIQGRSERHRCFWMPSHGKKMSTWQVPEGMPKNQEFWRSMNDLADGAATDARTDKERALRSRSAARDRLISNVEEWADRALKRCRSGAREYVGSDPHTDHYLCAFTVPPSTGIGA